MERGFSNIVCQIEESCIPKALYFLWGLCFMQGPYRGYKPGRRGWEKVRDSSQLAKSEGLDYTWIDTCCIDKSSSVEFSKAINSMFQWYRDAAICYAYLGDVPSRDNPTLEVRPFPRAGGLPAVGPFGNYWHQRRVEIGTEKPLRNVVSRVTTNRCECLGPAGLAGVQHRTKYVVGRRKSEDSARAGASGRDKQSCQYTTWESHRRSIATCGTGTLTSQ
ncbi:hypothetical protein B0T14DRAFT_344094 [Immersiella caudata]|uniref:Heterokaryon incompatibility domain-containing protein n=1 Tax=Immersiella caudata TaxID=314043 RepID=A0AA39WC82_9PEZI|nr:hypothetical protein B0T14DRAFT_344094 [Immersiella caudata]